MNPVFPTVPTTIFIVTIALIGLALLVGLKSSLKAVHSNNQTGATQFFAFMVTAWLISLAFLAKQGFFFKHIDVIPPRILLPVGIMVVLIIVLTILKRIGSILDEIPVTWLIYPQVFRVLIEIVLWQLHQRGHVPEQMTFEWLNFDIIAGITAPLVAFLCFGQGRNLRIVGIIWNILGLGLLLNIVTIAVLSFPAIAYYDQPNTFVAWFPYIWLPGFAVPFAMFLHAMSLRQLIRRGRKKN